MLEDFAMKQYGCPGSILANRILQALAFTTRWRYLSTVTFRKLRQQICYAIAPAAEVYARATKNHVVCSHLVYRASNQT